MLKRPSARRKTTREIQLNLVPILDAMVTLIGFLLFTMSFLSLVSIETPFPIASSEINQKKLKEKPLQLTVSLRENDVRIWTPFDKFEPKTIPYLEEGKPDVPGLHLALIEIKKLFPTETQIVLAPYAGTSYDILIAVMDGLRAIEKTDPPIFMDNKETGNQELVKALFPDIVFGNLLGDS